MIELQNGASCKLPAIVRLVGKAKVKWATARGMHAPINTSELKYKYKYIRVERQILFKQIRFLGPNYSQPPIPFDQFILN